MDNRHFRRCLYTLDLARAKLVGSYKLVRKWCRYMDDDSSQREEKLQEDTATAHTLVSLRGIFSIIGVIVFHFFTIDPTQQEKQ